jgi:hypothetical protein
MPDAETVFPVAAIPRNSLRWVSVEREAVSDLFTLRNNVLNLRLQIGETFQKTGVMLPQPPYTGPDAAGIAMVDKQNRYRARDTRRDPSIESDGRPAVMRRRFLAEASFQVSILRGHGSISATATSS